MVDDPVWRGRPLELQPDQCADEAVRAIYLDLLLGMEKNRVGLHRGENPDFLHQYRVALRRTRSGLKVIRKVLPRAVRERYRKDFKLLADPTGRVRDLDVLLMRLSLYAGDLTEEQRSRLPALVGLLERRRREAMERLDELLEGEEARTLLGSWRDFLESEPTSNRGKLADKSIAVVGPKCSGWAYERVLKRAEGIRHPISSNELHGFRKDFKDLRYMLRFFGGLLPGDDAQEARTRLMLLQDAMGDFNDRVVHSLALRKLKIVDGETPAETREVKAVATALAEALRHRRFLCRKEARRHLEDFLSKENRKFYRRLLSR